MTPSKQRVNYDLIAHVYDEPGRDYDTDPNLVEFLKEKADPHFPTSESLTWDVAQENNSQLTTINFPAWN